MLILIASFNSDIDRNSNGKKHNNKHKIDKRYRKYNILFSIEAVKKFAESCQSIDDKVVSIDLNLSKVVIMYIFHSFICLISYIW